MPKAARAPTPAFTGFQRSALQFWHELAIEMNRDWFLANKDRYETEWVQPMTALLGDVTRRIAAAYKPLALGEPKIMRIYRDTRFSKDKAPYKTHIAGVVRIASKSKSDDGDVGNAAMYVHLGADEEFVGVGCYMMDGDKLAKYRKAVAGKPGVELQKVVGRLRKAGYSVDGHDNYKKVPRPFDPEHPRAELLKMKGLTGGPPEIPRGLLLKPQLADWLVTQGKTMAPLVKWLHRHVG
jgi:uncharacterized protein (TIGR02453 family)